MKAEEQFHEHHQRLIDHFEELRERALRDPKAHGEKLVGYLEEHIEPHAEAEEEILYAEVDHLVGNEIATGTMRWEHDSFSELIGNLGDTLDEPETFSNTLETLSTLLLNHFKKEEDVLIPYLSEVLTEKQFLEILGEVHEEEEHRAQPD